MAHYLLSVFTAADLLLVLLHDRAVRSIHLRFYRRGGLRRQYINRQFVCAGISTKEASVNSYHVNLDCGRFDDSCTRGLLSLHYKILATLVYLLHSFTNTHHTWNALAT